MDLKTLENILDAKSVPSMNRLAGTSYSTDTILESARIDFLSDICKDYDVKICESEEEKILSIIEKKHLTPNQKNLQNLLNKFEIQVSPLNNETPIIKNKIVSESKIISESSEKSISREEINEVIDEVIEDEVSEEIKKDVYNAGPCPECGLFAHKTWRHKGAPVACINDHMWFKNTQIMAKNETDMEDTSISEETIGEEKIIKENASNISLKIKMCPDYGSLFTMEEEFNKIGLTIVPTASHKVILCKIKDNKPSATKIFEDFMFIGSHKNPDNELSSRLVECISNFISKAAGTPTIIEKSKKTWLQSLAMYGEAFGVEQV